MDQIAELKQRVAHLERNLHREVWMDAQDLFEMLHISKRTLQHWRNNGIIPFYKIEQKVWYKRSEVEQMLERNKKHQLKLKVKTA
jgi:hypothetical protein